MDKSLFECISAGRTGEGILAKDFKLPEKIKEEGIRFADGAMDGIYIYHMGHTPTSEEEKQKLGELLDLAGQGAVKEAEEGFQVFCEKHRALSIIDDLQQYIMDHTSVLDPNRMYEFAVHMLRDSCDKECVKIGLCILELLNSSENEELAETIRIVGLSDEFTIFSLFCMRNWPAAEKELLELAKKVRGWGRIHCVDFIDAESEETKDWLFYNGVDNDVVPAYSAWVVYEKANVEERLKKDLLTYGEMHALLKITDALLDEGPVSGISRMEDPRAFLAAILEKAKGQYPFTEEDRQILTNIAEWKE